MLLLTYKVVERSKYNNEKDYIKALLEKVEKAKTSPASNFDSYLKAFKEFITDYIKKNDLARQNEFLKAINELIVAENIEYDLSILKEIKDINPKFQPDTLANLTLGFIIKNKISIPQSAEAPNSIPADLLEKLNNFSGSR
jgi:hypothetical protein